MKMYNVLGDGTLQEIPPKKEHLQSDKVIIVIDDESQKIFVWKGKRAEVRKKFIAARQASNLRMTYGFNFRVVSLDEGDEDEIFSRIFKLPIKPSAKVEPKKETRAAVPTPVEPIKPQKKPTKSVKPKKPPTITAKELATRELAISKSQVTEPSRPVSVDTDVQKQDQEALDAVTVEIEKLPVPTGMKREMIVVGRNLYTVSEKRTMFFGEVKIERKLELIKNPPEGEFFAEEYVPRIIIKDGQVLLIDFLKPEAPELIAEKIKPEAKQHLSDLIKFFEEIKAKK